MKKNQKMFYYSSEYNKQFIEGRIEDIAEKEQRSSSYIIENILLRELLPRNTVVGDAIRINLYSGKEKGGVAKTLNSIFSYNAGGLEWKSLYSNFKPLVEYCMNYSLIQRDMNYDNCALHYLKSRMEDVVNRIENCIDYCIETYDKRMYLSQLELARYLFKGLDEKTEEIDFTKHFQLVLDCWDMLDDWSFTYRYLSCLVSMCEFQENSIARNELFNILNTISEEWSKGE